MAAPNELTIDRRAAVQRRQLDDTSWVDVVHGFVRDADTEFQSLFDTTPWQQTEVLRYDNYVPERRLSAALRPDSRPLLRQIDLHLGATYRVPFSGVAAILYRNGDDFQGLHSDREMRWLDDTLIGIVVLGQRRPFVFRRRVPLADVVERVPAGADPGDIVLTPGEGDLLVMGGASQRSWMHGVPMADTPNPRISLTWRWTSRRGRPDTNPGYYDGKQFSDRPRQPGSRRAAALNRDTWHHRAMESCGVCGFEWDAVPAATVDQRLWAAVERIVDVLSDNATSALERPTPDRWSRLEYAAHVRDVLWNLRDRIVLGAVEDNPVPKGMHPDERVALGVYAAETPEITAAELRVAAAVFGRTFAALSTEQLARPIFYGWPRPATRTLLWVAAQALHEAEHHAADVTD